MEDEKIATDMELATCLASHIREPCTEPTTGQDIRHFYVQEAEKAIPRLKNPFAIDFLKSVISQYDC